MNRQTPPLAVTVIPILLWILSWVSLKYVLPTFPSLLRDLNGTAYSLKLSIVLFLAFFAISQPLWGFVSEYWGRRKIFIASLIVVIIGTCIIIFSQSMFFYILGRCLEGVGTGALSPIGRAVYVDCFSRQQIARKMAVASSLANLMPAISPLIAGYILLVLNWRYVFVSFLIFTVIILVLTWFLLPETRNFDERFLKKQLLRYHFNIIFHLRYIGYVLCYALMTGSLLAFYAATPFWYVLHFKVSVHSFSYLLLITAVCYVTAVMTSRTLIKYMEDKYMFMLALAFNVIAAIAILLCVSIWHVTVPLVVVISCFFAFCAGFMMPLSNSHAMVIFKQAAGPASAVMMLIVFGGSSLLSMATMAIDPSHGWMLLLYFGACLTIVFIIGLLLLLVPAHKK